MDWGRRGGPLRDLQMRIRIKQLADKAAEDGDQVLQSILATAVASLDLRIAQSDDAASLPAEAPTALLTRNVRFEGRRTSVKLEPDFWTALEVLAERSSCAVSDLCEAASKLQGSGSLTSAIRVYALRAIWCASSLPLCSSTQ